TTRHLTQPSKRRRYGTRHSDRPGGSMLRVRSKSVEALENLADVGVLQGIAGHRRIAPVDGIEPVEHLSADSVIEPLELSLHVLDAANELRAFAEPPPAEHGVALKIRYAPLGHHDPAVEPLGDGLRVGDPVRSSMGFGYRCGSGHAAPVARFTSPDREFGAVLGGPTLLARDVELAGSSTRRAGDPPPRPAVEVLVISAQLVEVPACPL
ncbi:MAG TPA: hypothetical protein VFH02_09535, partial [Jiangellaceae bacterium]|nr:hypothetical protein [Jiangellaceae bacterium]